ENLELQLKQAIEMHGVQERDMQTQMTTNNEIHKAEIANMNARLLEEQENHKRESLRNEALEEQLAATTAEHQQEIHHFMEETQRKDENIDLLTKQLEEAHSWKDRHTEVLNQMNSLRDEFKEQSERDTQELQDTLFLWKTKCITLEKEKIKLQ